MLVGATLDVAICDVVGGSTYTFVVWDGHPLDEEAQHGLARYRGYADDLCARIADTTPSTGSRRNTEK